MKVFERALARGRLAAQLVTAISILAVTGCASTYEQSRVAVSADYDDSDDYDVEYVEADYFYDDLAPYGSWVEYSPHGWVWTPYDMPLGWRPYSDGYWAYTDYGWSWMSYEPFGWATYHYGRWDFDPHYGWIWVPDTVWAPSWVAWQYGDGWAGWAPLPPGAQWRPSLGTYLTGGHSIPSSHWCFVEGRHLSQTKLKSAIVSVAKNESLLKRTRDMTRYAVRAGAPVNEGIDVALWERENGRKVPRLKVVDAGAPTRDPKGRVRSGQVEYFRPQIREVKVQPEPSREIRERAEVIPDSEVREQGEKERRRMEDALSKERSNLEREHQRERQGAKKKTASEELKKRQAAEKQALEKHAVEQKQVLEERQRKRIVKVEAPQRQEKRRAPANEETSKNQPRSKEKSPPKTRGR